MKTVFKRSIALFVVLLLILSVVGCGKKPAENTDAPAVDGDSTEDGTEGGTESGDKPKVAFLPGDMANESQSFSAKQFEKFADDYDLDLVVLDGKGDAQVQAQVVSNCIAQGIKAIFVNPNDVNAIVPSLMEAKKAGIIVGMFSSDLPKDQSEYRDFFVGVNDNMAGESAAKAFLDHFPDGANIVEVGGQAGHDAQIKRHDGFNDGIEGSKINVLDYQCPPTWSTSEAMSIMEDLIVKYGDEIEGVFCHWDNGATGVIEALKAANMMDDMFIVAVDGCRAGFDQVRSGEQSITIMQNFETQAKKTLELARTLLDGGTVEEVNMVPLDIVGLDNIDDFTVPEW